MLSLLIYLLIIMLIAGLALYAVRMLPIDQPFKSVAVVIIVVIVIILLLYLLLGLVPGDVPRLR